jgi:hypothetical protein
MNTKEFRPAILSSANVFALILLAITILIWLGFIIPIMQEDILSLQSSELASSFNISIIITIAGIVLIGYAIVANARKERIAFADSHLSLYRRNFLGKQKIVEIIDLTRTQLLEQKIKLLPGIIFTGDMVLPFPIRYYQLNFKQQGGGVQNLNLKRWDKKTVNMMVKYIHSTFPNVTIA